MHRKLTVFDSFLRNSEAISPSPAPCSQSRTRSRLVRICTARDQENKLSEIARRTEIKLRTVVQTIHTIFPFEI